MKNATKYFALALSLLLFLLLPCGAFAAQPEQEYPEGQWRTKEGSDSLFCDETEYVRLPLSSAYGVRASVKRSGSITINEEDYFVGVAARDPDLVFLYENRSQIQLWMFHSAYCRKDALSNLDGFLSGSYDGYFLDTTGYERTADKAKTEKLRASLAAKGTEIDVTLLKDAKIYDLYGTYRQGVLIKEIGGFYKTLSGVYYVDYAALPNSAFDSSGNLSTREGTVKALLLEGDDLSFFEETIENGEILDDFKEFGDPPPAIVFWIMLIASSVFFGFLLPLIPLVFSVVQLIRKKTRHPRSYIAIAVLSLLWTVLFVLILLILLL